MNLQYGNEIRENAADDVSASGYHALNKIGPCLDMPAVALRNVLPRTHAMDTFKPSFSICVMRRLLWLFLSESKTIQGRIFGS